MATLKIPESEYLVLKKLAELDEPTFLQFFSAVENADTTQIQLDFSQSLASKVSSLKPSEMKPILKTVSGLYALMYRRKKTPQDVTNDLKETFEEKKPNLLKPEQVQTLIERIQKFLSLNNVIGFIAKAQSVMAEQDSIFCGVKVLTDIRPIFTEDADSISGAVIVHNLKISYHKDGEHLEFFAALNGDDKIGRASCRERV